jgi:glucose-1-phosphate cytidylyltransferase
MKIYSFFGFNEFIILTGYKSHIIKNYFINYQTHYSDITIDMSNNTFQLHENRVEPWKVTILYTGENTMTGGRLLAAKDFIGAERFMLTYGDGVSNIDIPGLIEAHKKSGKYVTLTAVRPSGRFGALDINQEGTVNSFKEKPEGDNSWINGGFFVMEPIVFDYLTNGADTVLERKPLETLASENQLHAYKHSGFWQAMDTLRDKNELTELWQKGTRPWALWGNGF